MHRLQAAIALLTRYGGSPTNATVIFDTFTFNPNWPELQQSKSNFAARADDDSTLAMRVFKMKHKEYVRQAWSGELYTTPDGNPNPVICYVSVLEYTPTGLSKRKILLFKYTRRTILAPCRAVLTYVLRHAF